MNETKKSKYSKLLAEQPKFHAQFGDNNAIIVEAVSHALSYKVLDWILQNVAPGSRTLETGCGYSTVVFSLLEADHVVISPFSEEHEAIKCWCSRNGITTKLTRFIPTPSQMAVPCLEKKQLDLVLIDGDHAFPAPFIDWYYTADLLKPGGLVIVDDTQIITGTILREFLMMERGRWNLEAEIGKTSIFKKVAGGSVTQVEWFGLQPFCAKRTRSIARRIKRKLGKVLIHREDAIFCE